MTRLTNIALADALYAAGLAPAGVQRFTEFPHGPGDQVYLDPATGVDWQPWASLDAVAHLLERYTLTLAVRCGGTWLVVPALTAEMGCLEGPFAQLPTLIGNLALVLRAREQEQEGGHAMSHNDDTIFLDTPRCPKCGCKLLYKPHRLAVWCSLIGCTYGLDTPVLLLNGELCERPKKNGEEPAP